MANSREARALNRELREIHKGGILEKIYERQENAKKEAEGAPAKDSAEESKATEKKEADAAGSECDKAGSTSTGPGSSSSSAPPHTASTTAKVASPHPPAGAGAKDPRRFDLTVSSKKDSTSSYQNESSGPYEHDGKSPVRRIPDQLFSSQKDKQNKA